MKESIKQMVEKIKFFQEEIFYISILLLVGFMSFGLGRLSKIYENKDPILVEEPQNQENFKINSQNYPNTGANKKYLASKNGKNYYSPWCSGVSMIKKENIVWFSSVQEAEAAGYKKASGCKGM